MIFLLELLKIYPEALLIRGESQFPISGISRPEFLQKNQLFFIKNKKFWNLFKENRGSAKDLKSNALVIEKSFYESMDQAEEELFGELGAILIVPSIDASLSYFSKPLYDLIVSRDFFFHSDAQARTSKVDRDAIVAADAFIGENVVIERNVQVMSGARILGNVTIGEGTIIFPNVVIYPLVKIGKNCRIHANTTIGADGFGYNFINGEHLKVWHFGGVVIGDQVEVGANSCIDAGSFQPTKVGSGTKIDNQVQVAHNSDVGKHVILCGQAALGGSAKLGDYCVLAARAGAGPGIELGQGVQIAGGGMANRSWEAGSTIGGFPAFELKQWIRSVAEVKKLGEREKKS